MGGGIQDGEGVGEDNGGGDGWQRRGYVKERVNEGMEGVVN